ncbi:alpha/beta hydrolase [Ectobacillus ponti]|uniref:Alpha/beta fold hydrolase n=1 Tax=Ectobacillus ponti TaxID=2961894 RepID=A0AA41X4V1_9BACI|nr:alpha/beta fold hydrolase [Ectobacillus ponti]MCP8967218.1 alpha/beta fold hydrolase [Ectobacillus ponti]
MKNYPILPGAEAFFFPGGDTGILISHGFSGTPQSVRFLGESLAAQGFTVYGVRLAGHGTHYEEMAQCTYKDWLHSLEQGYQFLQEQCREIYVIGQSMGGTLTSHLAGTHPVAGIILINAAMTTIPAFEAFRHQDPSLLLEEDAPDIKDPDVYEITYTKAPVSAIQQLLQLADETRTRLSQIHCPVLAFASVEDHVVPPENTDEMMQLVRSDIKQIVPLYDSYHVASMDYDKEKIAAEMVSFIQSCSAPVPQQI